MGFKTYLVLEEEEEEVDLVLDTWPEFNIRPMIGLQGKLCASDTGEYGKFGLTRDQIRGAVRKLKENDVMDRLRLLRLDIGSQTPSTATAFDAVSEATETYCELAKLGARMQAIDVGGDFCLNYDGCLSDDRETEMSVVHNLDEYAYVVVGAAQRVCDKWGVPQPVICNESGRFMLSHHSVLVFEPISSTATVKPITILDPVRPSNVKLCAILQTPGFSAKRPCPVIPLHCIDQQPQVEGAQLDPTGGSTGVPHHEHKQDGGRNYMGMFLIDGEALHRVHNIFGELSSIRVELSDEVTRYKVTHVVQAASCEEIAQERQQDPRLMLEALKQQVSKYDLPHWTVTVLERVFRSSFPGGR
ncbi:arginine decarboxylase [Musa troglodytarum]|uniref:Arginine decarboxylase n=1 Tax=Musa troglodytarum TaxID=320322 RepID=A0A9E7FHD3_9LILI|nr:arginine decarboxylase [Musa troglodytarum]